MSVYLGNQKVSVDVYEGGGSSPTLITKSITQNGTYNASSDNADGYSQVTVNVSGGGGGDVPLLSKSAWDALTTAQKQAYGLVAVQDALSGFKRGQLLNGADYMAIGQFIPYSSEQSVICEAYYDNYDVNSIYWGYGDSPITFNAAPSKDAINNAIYFPTKTNSVCGFVNLGSGNQPFTAYLVAKLPEISGYGRIVSAALERRSGRAPMLYGSPIKVSKWGDATSLDVTCTDWVVMMLQCSGPSNPYYGAAYNGMNTIELQTTTPPAGTGQYLTLARTDNNMAVTSDEEPTDIYVRYLAVVDTAESSEAVIANMQELYNTFIGGN